MGCSSCLPRRHCGRGSGKRPAIVLAALFFFGVLIHYYLVLCLIPFAAEEAYNWRPWRRPSARLMGAVLGAFAGLALLLPQILGSRRAHGVWWTAQGGRQVPGIFTEIFPAGLFLLALATLWVVVNERSGPVAVKPVSAAERTCWFALAIPIAGFVIARLVTHAFLDRYFIGLLPGVAVGFSCLLWRRFPNTPRIAMGILLLFAGYGVANQALAVLHSDDIKAYGPAQERTRAILAMEEQLASRGVRYIVLDDRRSPIPRSPLLFQAPGALCGLVFLGARAQGVEILPDATLGSG